MRVLFVVPYPPSLIRVRPYNLVKQLALRGHQVVVAALWTNEQERGELEAVRSFCKDVVAVRLLRRRSAWNCLRALPVRTPLQAVYAWEPALAAHVAALSSWADVIHVEHLRGARYALEASTLGNGSGRRPVVVWDSVDCISSLFEQAARNSRSLRGRVMTRLELDRTRRYEAGLVRRFDRVLVTSQADRQALHDLDSRFAQPAFPAPPPITVLPNGVDLDYFTPTGEPREPARLVLTGKMSYHANVTAAIHLVHDIMPHVWARRPDVRLWIVGKDPSREVRSLATTSGPGGGGRVVVTGAVPDIRPYLRRASIAVAPVQYGVGIQNKVLEAMACAAPVVSSPQAVSALCATPGRDVVVAANADAFAHALLALLDDPARRDRLGRAGRVYVERHHAWPAIAGQLDGIYQAALSSIPRQ